MPLRLDDRQYLRVLAAARRTGALVTVHCENYDAIGWRTAALLAAGHTAPKYHAWSRPKMVEREATHRAIALAELVDQPIQIFHVSCTRGRRRGRARAAPRREGVGRDLPAVPRAGRRRHGPPGLRGCEVHVQPRPARRRRPGRPVGGHAPRHHHDVSSDHSGWSYDGPRGKRSAGEDAPFRDIPNGVPGLAARLPILFSEGVARGRITASEFVRADRHQPGQAVRPGAAQGQRRHRCGRRPGAVGSRRGA